MRMNDVVWSDSLEAKLGFAVVWWSGLIGGGFGASWVLIRS